MLEMIREYMMRRLQENREKAYLWEDKKFTPKCLKLIEKFKKWSGGCFSVYAGFNEFEVTTVNGSKYAVNLSDRTCGCRRWDITGIPCHHVIASINRLGYDVEDYVDSCYLISNYKNAYSGIIYPMNNSDLWDKDENLTHTIKPPTVLKQPGRPKKNRNLSAGEDLIIETKKEGATILSKKNQKSVKCSSCKQIGHNKRTCPNSETRGSTTMEAPNEIPLTIEGPVLTQCQESQRMVIDEPSLNLTNDQTSEENMSGRIMEASELTSKNISSHVNALVHDAIQKAREKNRNVISEPCAVVEDSRATQKTMSAQVIRTENNKPVWNPNFQRPEQHNTYTGPMKLGKLPPMGKLGYKLGAGGVMVKAAPFTSKSGVKVITKSQLNEALAKAKEKVRKDVAEHKEKDREEDKAGDKGKGKQT